MRCSSCDPPAPRTRRCRPSRRSSTRRRPTSRRRATSSGRCRTRRRSSRTRRAGELFVVELDGAVAAAFVLQREDRRFWGERPDDALYLHKLAVRRSFAGRGLGVQVVEWALARTRAEARTYLRLDCMRDNPEIRAYYEALGFEERGEVDIGAFVCSLYERVA